MAATLGKIDIARSGNVTNSCWLILSTTKEEMVGIMVGGFVSSKEQVGI